MEYRISEKMQALKPSAIREIFKALTDPTIISLAAGNPSPESFPVEDLARISSEIFSDSSTAALQYSVTEGYPPLREDVKARLASRFGIGRDFDMTIITSGGQQGIELLCKTMCDEGDTVIVEEPSFIGALNAFRSNGAKLVGIPMEDDGIDIGKLEDAMKNNPRAKILYLIPTFQNPSGTCMSLEKRKKVYDLAKKYNIIILEDNPYGELRFAGEEIPTIKSFDEDGYVVYSGSYSKVLSAGMRIGFICGPEAIVQKMVVAKQVEDVHTNIFFQMLCHRYIAECDMDKHVADIRKLYKHKCDLMLSELDKKMPKCVRYTRPEGGLFLWCTLPDNISQPDFVKAAMAKKVAVVPGQTFNSDPNSPSQSFRLNYSTPSDEQIVEGIDRLAETVNSML
ncbi:MAG: PLP-dependent aminotransferase family protein [Clostridiales bacterium]|nr:PLP-dependent aminotransferase family protein [Clostridiales bacterium]MDY4434823.1 PLP-dependent aminotransferase family protein [Candidatus Flemingibacterium sp.]